MTALKAGDTVRIKDRLNDYALNLEPVDSGAIGELISLLEPPECVEPDGDCDICPNAGEDYHPMCWTEWYNPEKTYWMVRLDRTGDEWYIIDKALANVADLI